MKARSSLLASLLAGALALAGCGGSGPQTNNWSQEKQDQIVSRETSIQSTIDSAADMNSIGGRQAVAAALARIPGVSRAEVGSDGTLSVLHKEGIEHVWPPSLGLETPSDRSRSSAPALRAMTSTRGNIGSSKIYLVNALSEDTLGFPSVNGEFDKMASDLTTGHQEVTRLNGGDANLANLGNMSGAGVIVYLGHGGYGGNGVYTMQTGQRVDPNSMRDFWQYLVNGELDVMTVAWGQRDGEGNTEQNPTFFAIKPKFFQDHGGMLKKGIFLNCACSGAKDAEMVSAVKGAGADAFVGYSDVTNALSVAAARSIVGSLVVGKTLQESFDLLPQEDRQTVTPNGAKGETVTADIKLIGDGSLTIPTGSVYTSHLRIDNPLNDSTITQRVITVRGAVLNPDSAWRLSMELNGTLSRLSFDSSGAFSQSISVRPGENTLKISLETDQGREVQQFQVTGDFPVQDMYTEMTWDTDLNDIDVHLLPVGATPWTTADCYFRNKSASFGASLDVDDVNGRGPEHITGTTIAPGTYRLFIHYWALHGQTSPVRPRIAISTPAGDWSRTCPQTLSTEGQIWEVGTITYPGGAFTPNDVLGASAVNRDKVRKD